MFCSNQRNSAIATTAFERQYKTLILCVIITGVLSFVLSLGTPAHAQSTGRLNIQQIGNALTSYGKNTINNNGQIYYTVNCAHESWKSSVTISLSPNSSVIWMDLDLVEVPAHVSPTALANLLKKNTDLGPVFFTIHGNRLSISSPVPNYDMSDRTLKEYLEQLVTLAVKNQNLWDPQVLGAGPSPTHGTTSHSSGQRSLDEFDRSLQARQ